MDDASALDIEAGDIAVEGDVDLAAASKFVGELDGEIHRRRIAERHFAQMGAEGNVRLEGRQFENAHRLGQPGLEVGETDGPGGIDAVDLVLEIGRIERPAPATPVVGGAAELS